MRPCSLPGCAASRAMAQSQPPVNLLPALGTLSSLFGAERDGAAYGPEKGGGGGRRVLPLRPMLCPVHLPPLLQRVAAGSSAGPCPLRPTPPREGDVEGCGGPLVPGVGSCLSFPTVLFLAAPGAPGCWEGCVRSRQRLLLTRPALFVLVNPRILSPRRTSSHSFITVTRETAPRCRHGPGQGEALEQVLMLSTRMLSRGTSPSVSSPDPCWPCVQ